MNPLSHDYLTRLALPSPDIEPPTRQAPKSQKSPHKTPTQSTEEETPIVLSSRFVVPKTVCQHVITVTREGYLLAYSRKDGHVSGSFYCIFGSGVRAQGQIIDGRIRGWVCLVKKGVFWLLSHFENSALSGKQFSYDYQSQLFVESTYKYGQLAAIKQGQVVKPERVQRNLTLNLKELLHKTLRAEFLGQNLPVLESSQGIYYGEHSRGRPEGLGVLLTQSEAFYGQFHKGSLNGWSVMHFSNTESYLGQTRQGQICGLGCYQGDEKEYRFGHKVISKADFEKNTAAIAGFEEVKQLSDNYIPILRLYQKMAQIYSGKLKPAQKQLSVCDVKYEEKSHQGSGNSFSELILDPYEQGEPGAENVRGGSQTPKGFQDTVKFPVLLSQTEHSPTSRLHKAREQRVKRNRSRSPSLMNYNQGVRPQKMTDQDWNEVIQQLKEESPVGKEDGFLEPQNQRIYKRDAAPGVLYKNNLNSRMYPNFNIEKIKKGESNDEKQSEMAQRFFNKKE